MEHSAELLVHSYIESCKDIPKSMSETTIQSVVEHVKDSLGKQFNSKISNEKFRLRASNIGKAPCQLWFQKNNPEAALPLPSHFLMRMLIGDITEAVFKGVLKEAGVVFEQPEKVEVDIAGEKIQGEYDLIIDGRVDDIKSASPWSYKNKWIDGDTVESSDPFGYVGQLTIYAKGKGVQPGGWWVVNHSTGEFKYIKYTSNPDEVTKRLENTVEFLKGPFKRCYSPVKETFYNQETGRYVLASECKFCSFKYTCWGDRLKEEPSKVSKAKIKPLVSYVSKGNEDEHD